MRYVIANWKMYPQKREDALRIFSDTVALTQRLSGIRVAICPPFVWLSLVAAAAKSLVWLGAQDAAWAAEGAFTGEISPAMLKNIGCKMVIVGHSERRKHVEETSEMIAKKTAAVLGSGLYAVLCVGERQREGEWEKEIIAQTRSAVAGLNALLVRRLIIAYEPVWAIGTGRADTAGDAVTSILLIRRVLTDEIGDSAAKEVPVLYGGSVSEKNVREFSSEPEIDGFLVGHASLNPAEFARIAQAAQRGGKR